MDLTNATFSEILDDLSSRFIINVPEEELASVERICFQIEQAHWFYEDFIREQNPNLPSFTLKNFSAKFFQHCPLLHQWSHEHEKAFADFMQYKIRVPVCGAIMLNDTMDECVLVKGWSSRAGWGFPKGKINKDEPDSTCAAREVLEETGYDISPLIKETDYVELTIRGQRIRLYIVVGVPQDTEFCPRTRKEISKIEWHKLLDLPTWIRSKDKDSPYHCGGGCVKYGSSRFYMVVPFVSKLRHWVKTQKRLARKRSSEPINQDEATEADFHGHTDADPESIPSEREDKTSPSTSAQGTEGEESAHEKSPIRNEKTQREKQPELPNNILRTILGVEGGATQHLQSYFVNGPPPVPPLHSSLNINPISLEKSKINRDITAPIPRPANSNVNIAALDPELQRNSLLNLFADSTASTSCIPSIPVDYEQQRKNSLLSLLQPETTSSVIPSVPNGMNGQTVQDQIIQKNPPIGGPNNGAQESQARLLNFLQHSSTSMTPADSANNGLFSMFAQQQVPIHAANPVMQPYQHQQIPEVNGYPGNRRDSMFSFYSREEYPTSLASQRVGFVGQGRPHNHPQNPQVIDHTSQEIDEVSRKMSLLGLLSSGSVAPNRANQTTNGNHVVNNGVVKPTQPISSTYFSNGIMGGISQTLTSVPPTIPRTTTPNVLRASHENLLRLITASPPPQFKTSSGDAIDAEIQEQERALMRFLKFASGDNNDCSNDNDQSATASIDSAGSSTTVANEMNYNDLDRIGANIDDVGEMILPNGNVGIMDGGKNSDFVDFSTYFPPAAYSNNVGGGRNEYGTNAVRGYGAPMLAAGTIGLAGLPPDPRHISTFPPPPEMNNRSIPQETLITNHNNSIHYQSENNAFLNFKFDVDKILAAM